MRKVLICENAPKPLGPYAVAVSFGDLIFTSGQIGLDKSGNIISDDIKGQTRQVIENIKSILEENGSSLSKVLKVTVFLKDMDEFVQMNEVYNEYFKDITPARSAAEASRLPKDARIEIDAIAYK